MQITGKIHSVGETKQFESGFMVQEFYLDLTRYNELTGECYENWAKFQNLNEKLDLGQYNIGDIVKVDFYISGRKYTKNDGDVGFVQNLNAHKMELVKATAQTPQPIEQDLEPSSDDDNDELPF